MSACPHECETRRGQNTFTSGRVCLSSEWVTFIFGVQPWHSLFDFLPLSLSLSLTHTHTFSQESQTYLVTLSFIIALFHLAPNVTKKTFNRGEFLSWKAITTGHRELWMSSSCLKSRRMILIKYCNTFQRFNVWRNPPHDARILIHYSKHVLITAAHIAWLFLIPNFSFLSLSGVFWISLDRCSNPDCFFCRTTEMNQGHKVPSYPSWPTLILSAGFNSWKEPAESERICNRHWIAPAKETIHGQNNS